MYTQPGDVSDYRLVKNPPTRPGLQATFVHTQFRVGKLQSTGYGLMVDDRHPASVEPIN